MAKQPFAFRYFSVTLILILLPAVSTVGQWDRPIISQPSNSNLRAVCAVDPMCVWVTGSQGDVLRTTDGGNTWMHVGPPQWMELEFRSLWAFGPNEALIASAGSPAIVLRTDNGGRDWLEVYRYDAPEAFFDALRFWDPQHGLAFSDPVNGEWLIIRTEDSGRTWQRTNPANIPPAKPGEAGFAASNSGLALATDPNSHTRLAWIGLGGATDDSSRLLSSVDGGASWEVQNIGVIVSNSSSGIFGVGLLPPKTLVLIGGDYRQEMLRVNNIAVSTDQGRSWRLPQGRRPTGFRSGITVIPNAGFVCVGPSGIEHSYDGTDWLPVSRTGFHAVTHDSDGNLWCVGSDGRVAFFRHIKS